MFRGQPSRSPIVARRVLAGAIGAVALAGAMTAPAGAARSCGDAVTISRGDTLAAIARECGSSVAALLRANPQIEDPRALQPGWTLRLPAPDRPVEAMPAGPVLERAGRETVTGRPANRDGLSADGYRPQRRAVQSMGIAPRSGPTGATVTVNASGLPAGPAAIGAGLPGADMHRLATVEVGAAGSLEQAVPVPDWARPGDDLVFTVRSATGTSLTSGRFLVTGSGGADPVWLKPAGVITVSGILRQGKNCMLLETAQGHRYALVSDNWTFTPGAPVILTGRPARWMPCGAGRGTIEVLALRSAAGGN